MGIWDRLGSVINSHMNDFSRETNSRLKSQSSYYRNDPDLDAAYEELNDYLNPKAKNKRPDEYSWQDAATGQGAKTANAKPAGVKLPPEELRADFKLLGVPFGADNETCKAAYKKLLKLHHPDRHAGHESNYKKATERSAKINAAWDRIEKYRQEK